MSSEDQTVSDNVGLRVERQGTTLWLTLDRPQRRNALTLELVECLSNHVLHPGEGVRAVVITGTPPAFCAGADISVVESVADQGPLAITNTVYARFHQVISAIAQTRVPVIAAINGAAFGGGLDLALWCDFRVASEDAKLASSWIRLGLVPGMGGAHLLTRLVGPTRAAEMVLLGEPINARQALDWGIVNAVVAADELLRHAADLADRLGAHPPAAIAQSKAALRRARDTGMDHELATLGAVQGGLGTAPEFRQAVARFR